MLIILWFMSMIVLVYNLGLIYGLLLGTLLTFIILVLAMGHFEIQDELKKKGK
jgi:hypothetical protein